MKKLIYTIIAVAICHLSIAQIKDPKVTEVWEPVPKVVDPGNSSKAPSDAIVLFDGTNLNEWESTNGSPAPWIVKDGYMEVKKSSGDIITKREFGDIQLHVEWRTPTEIVGEGQGRGNSGVYLQNKYEIQVLDSYNNTTYPNGQAGALYKQSIPLVNATIAPGEWNVYDIIFKAPTFNEDGYRTSSGYVTVLHNGVLIQNHVEIKGTTEYIGLPKNIAHGKGPIKLQYHGNPLRFRNVWVREL
jgi:hypothetical protein